LFNKKVISCFVTATLFSVIPAFAMGAENHVNKTVRVPHVQKESFGEARVDKGKSASHNYTIAVDIPNKAPVGQDLLFSITTLDNGKPVPNQKIHIHFEQHESQNISVITDFTDTTSPDGTDYVFITGYMAETVHIQIAWYAPNKKTIKKDIPIVFYEEKTTPTPIPSDDQIVTQVPIKVFDNAIYFDAHDPKTNHHIKFQLDTGAYESLINPDDAKAMHLPKLDTVEIQGVGGVSKAYESKMDIAIGGVTFHNVPCIIDPDYQDTSLFGYNFFNDNNYDVLISLKHYTMTILK
jgi:hypothetical protein